MDIDALGFAPPQPRTVPAAWVQAKLGLASLSRSQAKALWRRADDHALAEALLKQCGSPSHIEQRMMSAANSCVDKASLDLVLAYFRKKVAGPGTNRKFVCGTGRSKVLMKIMRSRIDRDVEAVRSMCRACLLC